MQVFRYLLDLLFPPRESEQLVRGASADTLAVLVSPSVILFEEITITALLPYRAPLIQAAITEAKYHRNETAQNLLGKVLAEYVLELSSEEAALSGSIVLLPIPLSKERHKERGYNQVEQVCAVAAHHVPTLKVDSTLLSRIRDTVPQTTLARTARLQNMQGAFFAQNINPSYTYVVVDDVTTTGATLQAAVSALRSAGALHLIPLALAH